MVRLVQTRTNLEADRALHYAATFFAVAVLLHNSDHLRRGTDSLSRDVFWAGSAAMVLEVGVVAMVYARHRLAPLAAAAVGFSLAAGYVFVHFTPSRSWLSDSLPGGNVSALSWAAAGLEVAAALALGVAGARVVRERGVHEFASSAHSSPADGQSVLSAFRHPLVAVYLAGNLVIFLLSL